MKHLCINCGKADVRPDTVRLSGVVRSIPYEIEMLGLKCPHCGYSTVDAKGMTEFSRLLSDKYRAEHQLLTSDEIVGLRSKFSENQEQFARRCGIGVATLKRIEKGKIQDLDTNRRILEATRPRINDTATQFQGYEPASGSSNTFYCSIHYCNTEPNQPTGVTCISPCGYELSRSSTAVPYGIEHELDIPVELLGYPHAR